MEVRRMLVNRGLLSQVSETLQIFPENSCGFGFNDFAFINTLWIYQVNERCEMIA